MIEAHFIGFNEERGLHQNPIINTINSIKNPVRSVLNFKIDKNRPELYSAPQLTPLISTRTLSMGTECLSPDVNQRMMSILNELQLTVQLIRGDHDKTTKAQNGVIYSDRQPNFKLTIN